MFTFYMNAIGHAGSKRALEDAYIRARGLYLAGKLSYDERRALLAEYLHRVRAL